MYQFGPVFMDLVIFLDVSFAIEPMLLEQTQVGVKIEEVGLDLFYFYFLLFIFFSIYFSIFYF